MNELIGIFYIIEEKGTQYITIYIKNGEIKYRRKFDKSCLTGKSEKFSYEMISI